MKKLKLKHWTSCLAFLLLLVAGHAQYPIKDKTPITFMEDGGWCWYEDPRVIIKNGKLIIGAISGVSGDIRVGVYDLKRNTSLGVITLHENFEIDDHNSPVFYARPDGSILAFWAMHGKENKHYYSISDAEDYMKWSERKVYTHSFEMPAEKKWGGVTYMNLYAIKDQGLVYNFFRDGPTYNPSFLTSEDEGATWSPETTHFISDEVKGRQRPYARYTQIDENRIGVSFTDGHPRNYGNSLYYASFDGTSFYNANGSKIKDLIDGPLTTSESEKIYKGSEVLNKKPEGYGSVPNASWTCEMESDRKGNPYVGYTLYQSNTDSRFRLANWDGEKWVDREIAYAGACLYEREASYTGLFALDPDDPSKVIISTPVDPNTGEETGRKHEIYMAQVKNPSSTENIKWTQLTFDSEFKNIRPIIVSGEGYKVVLWLGGKPWRHFQDYESDVMGLVLQKPKK
ncbi:MAG: BNR-4 repeat-containing protein [Bacteroidota bacterium]